MLHNAAALYRNHPSNVLGNELLVRHIGKVFGIAPLIRCSMLNVLRSVPAARSTMNLVSLFHIIHVQKLHTGPASVVVKRENVLGGEALARVVCS